MGVDKNFAAENFPVDGGESYLADWNGATQEVATPVAIVVEAAEPKAKIEIADDDYNWTPDSSL